MLRKSLFSVSLLCSVFIYSNVKSQTIVNQGNHITMVVSKGGNQSDSVFRLPVRQVSSAIYPLIPARGRIQVGITDNQLYYHDGTSFRALMPMQRVLDSLTTMRTAMLTRAPKAMTLTVNGLTQDLSTNRTWTVPTISPTDTVNKWKPRNYTPTWSEVTAKPTLFSGNYNDLSNKPILFDGDYSSLSNKPSLFDGNYNTLINKPLLFDGNYNSLVNKPNLFSGSYNDLSNKPSIPVVPSNVSAFSNDANYLSTESDPTVPAQVKAITTANITNWNNAYPSSNPNGYISSVPAQSYSSLTGKPTTLSGYGITDAYPIVGNPSNFLTTVTASQVNTALGFTPIGLSSLIWTNIANKPLFSTVATTGNYNDLINKPTIPTVKRQETYSGVTNASGAYTVTFATPYTTIPNIQASITNQTNPNQQIRVTSVSTTGFTVNVFQRNPVTLLSLEVLLAGTVNVVGGAVDVLVTEK